MIVASSLLSSEPNIRLWSRATAVAVALHLTALGAMLISMRGEIEDESGAPAIEISMEPAAPRDAEQPDAPPGPLADESAAAAPSVASSEAKETQDEKIARAEAEDADLTREEKTEKPVEDERARRSQKVVSNESSASEATAPPKSEAQAQSEKPVAPTQGADATARAVKLTWQKLLMAHLNRSKRYPAGGGRRSAEVSIYFTLDRRGHILSYAVKHSSGQPAFDEAALAMMKRADPVPMPPPVMADEGLSFEVPVQFRAERR
ncbi:MAG TPA: TonB family protein [Methylocystis sp.]|nr:TonB family protein [Methylocystis sp.]